MFSRSLASVPALIRCGVVTVALCAPGARAQQETAIPVPPPVPPARPADLTQPTAPVIDAPRPPERPPELSTPAAKPEPAKPDAAKSEPAKSEAAKPDVAKSEAAKPDEAKPGDGKAEDKPPPLPPARPPELSGEAALALTVAAVDDTACRQRLERLGARFEPLPALSDGQCGAARPLKVTALAGDLALTPPATLVCGAAEALARWATEAQLLAERDLSQPLKGLSLGTTYVCRGQNHDPEAKLSEHAFANGIDVMAFTFAGRPALAVAPLPEGTPDAAFLAHARAKACGFFRTVLGPGTDAAHANHLHLDERERTAGHRLCQ